MSPKNYIRVRELPAEERAPFSRWLQRQACPVLLGVPDNEQDAAYVWDYRRWVELQKMPAPGKSMLKDC